MFGVGVTSYFNFQDKYYLKKALHHIDYLYVRDLHSKHNLLNIFERDSIIIPDVVLGNEPIIPIHTKAGTLYGITSFKRINRYSIYAKSKEEYYTKAYQEIINLEKPVTLFYTTQDDYNSCLDFSLYVKQRYGKSLTIVETSNLSQLYQILPLYKDVYSPRMHGCLLAKLAGANVTPICISEKMISYKKHYEDKQISFIEMKNILNNKARELKAKMI